MPDRARYQGKPLDKNRFLPCCQLASPAYSSNRISEGILWRSAQLAFVPSEMAATKHYVSLVRLRHPFISHFTPWSRMGNPFINLISAMANKDMDLDK